MIYLLLALLIIILLLDFWLNNNDIIAPSVLFAFSFTVSVMFASFYVKKWELSLHLNTFSIILIGVLEFSLVTLIVKSFFKLFRRKSQYAVEWKPIRIPISKIKLVLFVIFEILTICYSIYSVVKLYNGSILHFTDSVNQYRNQSLFGTDVVSLPKLVGYVRLIVEAGGYWFGYILINNYYTTRKIDINLLIIVLLSGISSYTMGGRNGIITLLTMLLCFWFIISNKEKQFKKTIGFKTLIRLSLIAIVALSSFESLAYLIGRGGYDGTSAIDYLAIYIGAPIKNLDSFLMENDVGKLMNFQSQTFIHLVNTLGVKLQVIQRPIKLDLPFQHIGNYSLGNVYTTFYSFIYDFGYKGVPILIFIMGCLSQISYELVIQAKKNFSPAISSLIYAYIGNTLIMSFFSNKFFEQIFDFNFLKMIIIWMLLEIIFKRINFVKQGV